ncbi:MAG TPA: hypothetical protein VME40_05585 [Caulobacteraceae bacterium]|nr:hypothetical protein [Caulobacteraceae bacterium]
MRSLVLGVVSAMFVALGCAAAATPMSMASFRDAYIAELRREAPSVSVKIVADDAVEVTDGKRLADTAYLDNAYAFYRQDPSQLRAILKRYVGQILATGDLSQYTAAQLRVLVRPVSYLPSDIPPGKRPLYRPLAGNLVALVAVDQPTAFAFPPADLLRTTLKLDDESLWARALQNTGRKLPRVPPDAGKSAVAAFTTGDGLASSMLAEPDLWDAPEVEAGGPPVVAPVEKDLVFMTRLGDPAGVAALRGAAAKVAGDPDGLTNQLFVRRNGAWEVLP